MNVNYSSNLVDSIFQNNYTLNHVFLLLHKTEAMY